MKMNFKDVVLKALGDKFAYKNGQPQRYTISKIIARYEGKEYIQPEVDILNKVFINTYIVSEDAKTEALKKWRNNVMSPVAKENVVKNVNALYVGNWYIYLEEGVNVGYIYAAITFGNVPILPSFFKEEFGECAVYYNAELIYPHYKFSLADFYRAINETFKNERLYYTKINCLSNMFEKIVEIKSNV